MAGIVFSTSAFAETKLELATGKYLDTIKQNPQKLQLFLHDMPKGGDLHNHHGGAGMAENMIKYAKGDKLCINQDNYTVEENPQCSKELLLDNAKQSPEIYDALIDAWSMRHFFSGKETGHDHFFSTFSKYGFISWKHSGEILSEIVNRAGMQNEAYLELMMTPDGNDSGKLGKQMGWDEDLARLREKLLNGGLKPIITEMTKSIDADEALENKLLLCGTDQAKPGCRVKVRYLYQVLREQAREQVFAQFLAGFEVASKDARFVGIDLVQPEDGKISMRDYDLQMRMVGFLHNIYPDVRISLHAGELVPGLVPSDGLRFHIREAVETAHAKRIGHGVDITYEDNMQQLLDEMAKNHIMVEINLSSNEMILGVKGKNHPVLLYMQNQVPVSLSTDDEGVIRTNLTGQYEKAILTYQFPYMTVKEFARNSISYSFLPGEKLWADDHYQQVIKACANDAFDAPVVSHACQQFLGSSEKARLQWRLEKEFVDFEKKYATR